MAYSPKNPNGQATMANSEPVVIASDQSTIPVSVSGVATAANQTTIIGHVDGIEGLLTTIDADTSSLAGAVAGTEVQVDVVASLPAGTNNIGDVDILSIAAGDNNIGNVDVVTLPSIPAGTNNIGDVDVLSMPGTGVEDSPETAGGTLLMAGTVRRDTAASSAGTTGDNATLNTDSLGRLWISGAAVEDAAETAGGILLMAGSVRRDTAASSAGTTGDNATINTDSVGALWTRDTATQVDDAAFTPATSRIMPVGFLADETATDSVNEGDAGAARMTLDRKQIVTLQPHTAGGLTTFRTIDLDETEEEIKATAGNLYGYYFANTTASARYLKLYNATAASVSVGTTTPSHTFYLPPTSAGHVSFPVPIGFSTALCAAATTGVADSDTGAPGANDVLFMAFYL